jgi:transposase-like protein
MVVCADGLTGIKEAISAEFPSTDYQRCIVHQVRNTLRYVSYKDRKKFATNLKTIYLAPKEIYGYDNMKSVTEKWSNQYPQAMKRWEQKGDALSPIHKFSGEVRKVIYTTNAIASLNNTYKKLNQQRSVIPSDKALLKTLYLSTLQTTKRWNLPIRGGGKAYGEFTIMYEGG